MPEIAARSRCPPAWFHELARDGKLPAALGRVVEELTGAQQRLLS
jgi:hypothetical protein